METMYDFEPTETEERDIAFNYLDMRLRCGSWTESPSKDWYLKNIKTDWAIFDIAVLLQERGREEEAQTYFEKIPAIAREYLLGQDYELIPS